MLVRAVIRHQIEQDTESGLVRGVQQSKKRGVTAVDICDGEVVRDVVTAVAVG
jgi:hypothetical protein